jgi:hypothetical protein
MEGLVGDEPLMIHGAYLEDTIMIGQNLPFLGTQTCGKLQQPS